ncbi:MAG: LPS-assembly protein LptD [Pyrinomonadaceae bacterium]
MALSKFLRIIRQTLKSPSVLVLPGILFLHFVIYAQQPNPIERQVSNPITDKPNVNPPPNQTLEEAPAPLYRPGKKPDDLSSNELKISAAKQTVIGPEKAHVVTYEGNVDARIGIYRLQADKVIDYEDENRVIAEGSVVLDQAGERITGSRGEWNYATKRGFFVNSTGFTDRTEDGTVVYFTADRLVKVSPDTTVAYKAVVTACEDNVPKWSFYTSRAVIKKGKRVGLRSPVLKAKGIPVFYLPYASVPTKKKDRQSGFLTPSFSYSQLKGFRLSNAYYQTLGRSADLTLRNDIYSARGLGFGGDFRARSNDRSFLDLGFFTVKDRILGEKVSPQFPDQGGSSLYARGVQYFPNGFIAVVDVNIVSNLAFRQLFSDSVQQAISPIEKSQVFLYKNFDNHSLHFLAGDQVTSIPNLRIRSRQLPSIAFDRRPSLLGFLKEKLPLYFSFESSLDGLSRKETADDIGLLRQNGTPNPLITPSIVQRFDFHPRFSLPLSFKGWALTTTAAARGTFYSDSIDPVTRLSLGTDVTRGYSELEVDLRPPALAKNYHHSDGSFSFRHLIEPYVTYRKISGIDNFENIIRFDYQDTVADTNEIEYGLTNRFFIRRSPSNPEGHAVEMDGQPPKDSQPYEVFSLTLRGKYFFDPTFGGALIPGQRNQFYPINTLSGYSYGGVPRTFSPVSVEATYRPLSTLFVDTRADLDTSGAGVRSLFTTVGLNRRLFQIYQSYYYTRAIPLPPSLQPFADAGGNEAGTLQGSQWSPSVFIGDRNNGFFGGTSFFFEFTNRPNTGGSSLVNTVATVGYGFNCCAVTLQNYTYNLGVRQENRIVFSFRLNGIGTFGTEQFGQGP